MLELFSWGPDPEGLPSFDPFCLSAEVYLNLAGVDWAPNDCNDTTISPSGALPVLQDSATVVCGASHIMDHLRRKGHDLDAHLTSAQRVDCLAYTALVEDVLYDALLHCWWIDTDNYFKFASPLYSRAMPFFLRYTGPQKIQERVMRRLAKYQTTVEVEGPEGSRKVHETYLLAEQALEALSRKLGTQKYFFGNKPSSLDVVVLSHLLLWLLERPPSDTLRRMAAKHQNLAAFCAAFRPVAFATQPRALAKQSLSTWISARYELLVKQLPLKSSAAKPFWKNFIPSKPVLNRIGSVVGVFVLFVAYVVRNGIVTIDFGGEEEEDAPPPKLLDINPADIPLDDYDYEYEYYDEMPEEDHMHGEEHDFGNGEEHDFGSDED